MCCICHYTTLGVWYIVQSLCVVFVDVQSLQDDEDDNMEDGIKLITNILGPDNVHLYPNILQLVMADGAYTEGSDYHIALYSIVLD